MTTAESTSSTSADSYLPLRLSSTVVRGFGRGSTDLGIPTANLDTEQLQIATPPNNNKNNNTQYQLQDLPCGIYWGLAAVETEKNNNDSTGGPRQIYKTALSIGYNPTYGNERKTIEPHLIADNDEDPQRHASSCKETLLKNDLYDKTCHVSVLGYLRPELPFEGLDKLIIAIKQDIVNTETLVKEAIQTKDPTILQEQNWLAGTSSS